MYNPVTRSYGEPHKRPEVQNSTVEFIASSDYMVRRLCRATRGQSGATTPVHTCENIPSAVHSPTHTVRLLFPSSVQLRPPQPAAYLFVLDVSHNAVEAGYLKYFCESLLENLDK